MICLIAPNAQLLVSDVYIERNELASALEYCQQSEQLSTEMGLHIYLSLASLPIVFCDRIQGGEILAEAELTATTLVAIVERLTQDQMYD